MPVARVKRPAPAAAVPNKKRPGKAPELPDTTLDSKKKAVAADEAKLREQMERYTRLIEEAPKRAKERERRQREEFVSRAQRAEHRPASRATLPDRRFEWQAGAKAQLAPERKRKLRAERNRGRFMFFILLLIFVAVLGWLYFTMTHSGSW